MRELLYLHVGAGKTGTSSIQRFLYHNRQVLQEQGLYISDIGMKINKNAIVHHELAHHTISSDNIWEKWTGINNNNQKITLVSSEDFHSKMYGSEGKMYFKKIKNTLTKKKIKIIFYIRRHSQWLQSAYSQWVKSGNLLSETYSEFSKKYPKNTAQQVIDFARIFDNVNMLVRPFEKESLVQGDLFKDFVSCLSLPWSNNYKIPAKNPNPRLSIDALELKRRINRFGTSIISNEEINKLLFEYSQLKPQNYFFTHEIASVNEQLVIEKECGPLYEKIAKDILKYSDGVLFKNDLVGQLKQRQKEKDTNDLVSTEGNNLDDVLIFLIVRLLHEIEKIKRKS